MSEGGNVTICACVRCNRELTGDALPTGEVRWHMPCPQCLCHVFTTVNVPAELYAGRIAPVLVNGRTVNLSGSVPDGTGHSS